MVEGLPIVLANADRWWREWSEVDQISSQANYYECSRGNATLLEVQQLTPHKIRPNLGAAVVNLRIYIRPKTLQKFGPKSLRMNNTEYLCLALQSLEFLIFGPDLVRI